MATKRINALTVTATAPAGDDYLPLDGATNGTRKILASAFALTVHAHAIADVTGLQAALDGKAASAHTHAIADVTNLQTTLDGKAASVHTHAIADVTGLQAALDGKAASAHTHAIADVTGLQAALDGKAASSHTHAIADVTNLQTTLDGKAATSHTHSAGDITSGTIDSARLPTTGVSPASYVLTNLTVDSTGRITAASSATAINNLPIGNTTPSTGAFTTLSTNDSVTVTLGTAKNLDIYSGAGGARAQWTPEGTTTYTTLNHINNAGNAYAGSVQRAADFQFADGVGGVVQFQGFGIFARSLQSAGSNNLVLGANYGSNIVIVPAGNIGFGTSPYGTSTLASIAGRTLIKGGSESPGDSSGAGLSLSYDTVGNVGKIYAVATGVAGYQLNVGGNPILFINSNTGAEYARMDSNGLGVGCTPATKLDVAGTFRATGTSFFGAGGTAGHSLVLKEYTTGATRDWVIRDDAGVNRLRFARGGSDYAFWDVLKTVSADSISTQVWTAETDLAWKIGASNRVAASSAGVELSGTVGIGGVPAGYKLTVYGSGADVACSDTNVVTRMIASNGASLGIVETATNHPLVFRTNQAERARVDANDFTLSVALKLSNAYVAGAPTATGYLVIKDSTGTSYKIPAVAL